MLQRYCEEYILIRLDLHDLRLREHMVTCAQSTTDLSLPICHIPFQSFRGDSAWLFQRDDAYMLAEHILLTILSHLDVMLPRLEEERQARAREEVDSAGGVVWISLITIHVVELANPLIEATTDATESDNVDTGLEFVANPFNGLTEVGRLLVGDVDYFGGRRLGGVEVADGGVKGIEVADDDLEVRLNGQLG